jgi:spoIIIJ-associated protein
MEWVETTGKTVEEAKELALDQLGVAEDDAEFEIVEEPRPGLFGRVRGEARVRARVKPTRPRPKAERRDRRKKDAQTDDKPADAADTQPRSPQGRQRRPATPAAEKTEQPVSESSESPSSGQRPSAEDVAAEAEKFMDGLLEALGLEGTTTVSHDGDDLELNVVGPDLGVLIGPRGSTLLAVQDLVRVASQRRIGDHSTRLRIDIAGYREKRREALARWALKQAEEVAATGEVRVMEPMPSADRKVIHDALAGRSDVVTRSEGEDPARRVVIAPAD